MKQYYLPLIFVFSLGFAQQKPKFGITLGATYSNIRGNEAADKNKYDFNFLIGGSIEVPLNTKFSFLGNINYERKTFKNSSAFNAYYLPSNFDPVFYANQQAELKLTIQYLTVPLNLKYYLDAQKKFFVNGGPFLGLFLNSSSTLNGSNTNEKSNNLFTALDFGANFGIGSYFKISEKYALNLELRHNYGLVNISNVPVVNNGSVKTNSFNLIANWQFN